MLSSFDVLLVDLQDLGCRIWSFITALRYVLEAAAKHSKAVWVLDRPNPARPPGRRADAARRLESFVGTGPLPMRHGLTMGELARWFVATVKNSTSIAASSEMQAGSPRPRLGYGWPLGERNWVLLQARTRRTCRWRAPMPHGDAGGHDAFRRPRHGADRSNSSARRQGVWLRRRRRAARMRALAPATVAAGLRAARMLVRADLPQGTPASCAAACDPRRGSLHYDRAAFRPWRRTALAFKAIRRRRSQTTRCGATSAGTNSSGGRSTSSTARRAAAEWVDLGGAAGRSRCADAAGRAAWSAARARSCFTGEFVQPNCRRSGERFVERGAEGGDFPRRRRPPTAGNGLLQRERFIAQTMGADRRRNRPFAGNAQCRASSSRPAARCADGLAALINGLEALQHLLVGGRLVHHPLQALGRIDTGQAGMRRARRRQRRAAGRPPARQAGPGDRRGRRWRPAWR